MKEKKVELSLLLLLLSSSSFWRCQDKILLLCFVLIVVVVVLFHDHTSSLRIESGQYSPNNVFPNVTGCHFYNKTGNQHFFHTNKMKEIANKLGINFISPIEGYTSFPINNVNMMDSSNADDGSGRTAINNTIQQNPKNPSLHFIPYRDFTSQFPDIHRKGECSHFCSTPDLWVPIWRTLRLIVDNYVNNNYV